MKKYLLAGVMALPLLWGSAHAGQLDQVLDKLPFEQQIKVMTKALHTVDIELARQGTRQPHHCSIPIVKLDDDVGVPVFINESDWLLVQVDTGYSGELQVPADWLPRLYAHGWLTKADMAGPITHARLADGRVVEQTTIIAREVILRACQAFYRVKIDIAPAGADGLIGEGLLSRFRLAGIDHQSSTLELEP